MVIRHLEEHPELANKIFLETGRKELRFIINFGFFFGFVLGIPTILLVELVPHWWVLPIAGTLVGYATNWLAIWMIFEPVEPRHIGRFKIHGLFLRRQNEAADVYANVIADDIVTLSNIGEELLHGPALGPHPPDDRDSHAAGRRPGDRHGPLRRARGGGHQGVRLDSRDRRGRGGGLHHDPAGRRGVQPAPERGRAQADRRLA